MFQDITDKVAGVADLLKILPDTFREQMQASQGEQREKICR